ncbi:aquaporin-7-like [Paramacrobiotus metropolitanus]|uniref:aquaporin-7-like n=1 Tax=Paramacrobiotus metropolitanus TaxID=2943436 RepID=UPI002445F34B|nr:aquaporin-7-like [Paramacrobiotus metropolitanus]XP_055338697.1 aquaporin-7-like [Paramacrobiotus metropolitanus]XP_055338698.1 aquaporin-7-like [Paramacrobiotus metropolitanus]XP_055338699.1 aquaporin-7-like [Paramacrobiotus metropolitanus]
MQLFKNDYVREFLAEFLGTFILIVFGNGAVAEVVLSKPTGGVNDFFSINIAYGLAVAFGVYVSGGVSGGHLNPAVSVAFACLRKLQWRRVPIYIAAQYIGAWFGSAIIMMVYFDALKSYEQFTNISRELDTKTAGIFASYPQEFLSWRNGFFDQIFGTMLLMIGVLALTDERNTNPHKGVVPILVGLLIAAIGLAFGFNCGYPINPARDLGPRIFTAMAGWGHMPFSIRDYNWFWIPVIGPHLGALLGALIYKYFISNHWPQSAATLESSPPLVIHTTHPATVITATPSYQPLKTSQSAYSQGEFR